MKTISVNIPEAFVRGLEDLVTKGLYANRSEAIRVSIRIELSCNRATDRVFVEEQEIGLIV